MRSPRALPDGCLSTPKWEVILARTLRARTVRIKINLVIQPLTLPSPLRGEGKRNHTMGNGLGFTPYVRTTPLFRKIGEKSKETTHNGCLEIHQTAGGKRESTLFFPPLPPHAFRFTKAMDHFHHTREPIRPWEHMGTSKNRPFP